MNIEIVRTTSLDGPVLPEPLHGPLYMNENQAHRFAISCTKNGQSVSLTGGVSGRFIRPDGQTILLSGSVTSGVGYVTLPQACYIMPGRFIMAIFNTANNATTTIYAATGNIARTQSGDLIDPGSVVPSIDALLAEIDAMRQATAEANAAAEKSVRYDRSQDLTDQNKYTARNNIDVMSRTEVTGAIAQVAGDAAGRADDILNNRAVRYDVTQTLNVTKQATARSNIGAASAADVTDILANRAVRYDTAQTLSDANQATARGNIGAASEADIGEVRSELAKSNSLIGEEIGLTPYVVWDRGAIETNAEPIDISTVNPDTLTRWLHLVVPCVQGEKYKLNISQGTVNARPYAIIDASGYILDIATQNAVDATVTAPENSAYLVCNVRLDLGLGLHEVAKGTGNVTALQAALTAEQAARESADNILDDRIDAFGDNAPVASTDLIATNYGINNQNKWISTQQSNASSGFFDLSGVETVDITPQSGVTAVWAFLDTINTALGETPDFSDGYSGRLTSNVARQYEYNVTGNMHYLYVAITNNTGDNIYPGSLSVFFALNTDKTLTRPHIPADARAVGDALSLIGEKKLISDSDLDPSLYTINTQNVWVAAGTSVAGFYDISGANKVLIVPNGISTCVWAFLNTINTALQTTPDFSAHYPHRLQSNGTTPLEYDIEDDMHYLYVLVSGSGGADNYPAKIEVASTIKTDETLSKRRVPADAKAVGVALSTEPAWYVSRRNDVRLAMLGDSITNGKVGGSSTAVPEMTIPQSVAKYLGVTTQNFGVNGMGWFSKANHEVNAYEYIQTLDLSAFTHVSLAYGTNDSAAALGTANDTTEDTILGSAYRVCNYIHTQWPTIVIYIILPILGKSGGSFPDWGWGVERGPTGAKWYFADFYAQFDAFGAKYHIPVIHGDRALNSWNIEQLIGDNVHPTIEGYKVVGRYMAGQIGALL